MSNISLRIHFMSATKKHFDANLHSRKNYSQAVANIKHLLSKISIDDLQVIIGTEFIFEYLSNRTNSLEFFEKISISKNHNFKSKDTQDLLRRIFKNIKIMVSYKKTYGSISEVKVFKKNVTQPINKRIKNYTQDLINYQNNIHQARNAFIQINELIQYINGTKVKKWELRAISHLDLDEITYPNPTMQEIIDVVCASIQARDSMSSAIAAVKDIQSSFFN